MNIWILNHYAVPLKYYYLARSYNFAKQLIEMGHTVTLFGASTVHNSNVNLINDKSEYIELHEDGLTYVLFYGRQYYKSNTNRIINHIEVAKKMVKYCPTMQPKYGVPSVIYASAGQTLTLWAGIKIAKKLGIKCVCEVTDLWPESFVEYGLISKKNPLLSLLYRGEKWVYIKADALIFSMEGGRDYIIDKGWDKEHGGPIDINKVYYINNGVDLDAFDYNSSVNQVNDQDLENDNIFKVVYTGSIRLVNKVNMLVDVARALAEAKVQHVKILIWGNGDEVESLQKEIEQSGLTNIVYKGYVKKNEIPYILRKSNLNVIIGTNSLLGKYGMSPNKLFEYLASGKPILMNFQVNYSIVEQFHCGICMQNFTSELMADEIVKISSMRKTEYETLCDNARNLAHEYDFKVLTQKLYGILTKKR